MVTRHPVEPAFLENVAPVGRGAFVNFDEAIEPRQVKVGDDGAAVAARAFLIRVIWALGPADRHDDRFVEPFDSKIRQQLRYKQLTAWQWLVR